MPTCAHYQGIFFAAVLLVVGPTHDLVLADGESLLSGVVAVSAKFIEPQGQPSATREQKQQLRMALAEANDILARSGTSWELALDEILDVAVRETDAVLVTSSAHRKLETRARADAAYAWRPNALNVYFVRRLGGRGICSLPSQGDIVVFDNTLGTLDGVLFLHEIGHYLSLTHTFECFHAYCDVDACTGAGALHRAPRGEVACPDTCPHDGNVMSYTWPLTADAVLSPCQLGEIEYELGNPAGHRSAVFRASPASFQRGNADGVGSIDMTDATSLLTRLFLAGGAFPCQDAADINDSGTIDMTDAVHLLGYLFLGSAPPAEPFLDCGWDTTPDAFSCVVPAPCGST